MRSKKWTCLVVLLVGASLVLAACPAPATPIAPAVQTVVVTVKETVVAEVTKVVEVEKEKIVEVTPVPEAGPKTLRVNLATYPDIIDPQKSSFVNEIAHLQLMYEGLTRLDKDLATVPGAAASWEYNEDATQLVFTLQPDLKYSDGTPLNAERYAYAIKRNINPETAGEYAAITDEIAGAAEWRGFTADEAKTEEENAAAKDAAAAVVAESIKASHADGAVCEPFVPIIDETIWV